MEIDSFLYSQHESINYGHSKAQFDEAVKELSGGGMIRVYEGKVKLLNLTDYGHKVVCFDESTNDIQEE